MANMLQTGLAHLATVAASAMGATVVYDRAGERTTLVAVPGRTPIASSKGYGMIAVMFMQDFVFLVADFPYPEPRENDIVEYAGRRYEVSAGQSGSVWRRSDSLGLRIRVHTQEVSDVD
jgi:hypothetical protein